MHTASVSGMQCMHDGHVGEREQCQVSRSERERGEEKREKDVFRSMIFKIKAPHFQNKTFEHSETSPKILVQSH